MKCVRARGRSWARPFGRWGLATLVFVHAGGPAVACADERVASPAEVRTVRIALVADAALDPVFARRIATWFDPNAFRVEIETALRLEAEQVLSPGAGADARVWVTLRPDGSARLYFSRWTKERGEAAYLVRDIRLDRGLDEMGAERIAQAIHFSVVALLEGSASSERAEMVNALDDAPKVVDRALARDSIRQAAPRDVDSRRPKRAPDFGLGYAAAWRGDEGLAHGPRATVYVPFAASFAFAGSIRTALPATRTLGSVDLELYGASLALELALRASSGSMLAIDVVTGPGAELVHYEPVRSRDASISLGGSETEIRPSWDFGARAAFEAPIRWTLWIEGSVGLVRTHYDVSIAGSPRTIGRPWTLSPSIGVEFRF